MYQIPVQGEGVEGAPGGQPSGDQVKQEPVPASKENTFTSGESKPAKVSKPKKRKLR